MLKNGAEAGTYGYDYQGYRVWRSVDASGANTQYVFDTAGHLLAEHNGSTGAVQKEYIWLGDLPVAVVDWTTGSPFIYYIHTGQMDEPLVLTNASKAKVWDAWVNPWGKAGTFGTPSEAIDLRLPGQWLQLETNGLHQNWHRDYDPSIGRYVQADPLGIEAGQNPFAYAYDQPLTYSDPEGLCPAECKKLRGEIFLQFAKLQKEFLKYDPVEDAKGGFRMRGGRLTVPGGHYAEILDLQQGLRNRLYKWYKLRCWEDDDDGPGLPPIPRSIDEASRRPVAKPKIRPPGVPFVPLPIVAGEGAGEGVAIGEAALEALGLLLAFQKIE